MSILIQTSFPAFLFMPLLVASLLQEIRSLGKGLVRSGRPVTVARKQGALDRTIPAWHRFGLIPFWRLPMKRVVQIGMASGDAGPSDALDALVKKHLLADLG